jgi:copper chaperone CopZ
MTLFDVAFRYGKQPGPEELRAIDALREVYGIRQVRFNEKDSTIRVEFDASRMKEETVAALLRRAGVDLTEKLELA